MTKEELLQQLQVNDTKVAEINVEIAKQRTRLNTFEPRMVIREYISQLDYWRRDKKRITEALEKF